jgi:hypothetical protein
LKSFDAKRPDFHGLFGFNALRALLFRFFPATAHEGARRRQSRIGIFMADLTVTGEASLIHEATLWPQKAGSRRVLRADPP